MIDACALVSAIEPQSFRMLAIGLGTAFIISACIIALFILNSKIDHGFLGLIFLLTMLSFLIALLVLLAASTPDLLIRLYTLAINGLAAFGIKLLAPRFLAYLES